MKSIRSRQGISFTEVLFAIVILAIGLVAMAVVQTNSLRTNRRAETVKEARTLAEAEVDLRRSVALITGAGQGCLTSMTAGYSCLVDVEDCKSMVEPSTAPPAGSARRW